MHDVTSYLKELWEFESAGRAPKGISAEDKQKRIQKLRQSIPEQIIGHYDRFVKAGKVPVAGVNNGVCHGCFVRLSSGAYQRLLRQDDLNLCENCGRYIYPIPAAPVEPEPPAAPPRKRGRPKKVAVA